MRSPLTNEQVVQEWAARCARFDRELSTAVLRGLGVMLVAALPLLIPGMDPAGYGIFLVFFGIAGAWGIWLSHTAMLMCPRCNEPPVPISRYRHPRRARGCEHCGCQLHGTRGLRRGRR